jgi:hypothetical protein
VAGGSEGLVLSAQRPEDSSGPGILLRTISNSRSDQGSASYTVTFLFRC